MQPIGTADNQSTAYFQAVLSIDGFCIGECEVDIKTIAYRRINQTRIENQKRNQEKGRWYQLSTLLNQNQ
jgi:hypothetical protein